MGDSDEILQRLRDALSELMSAGIAAMSPAAAAPILRGLRAEGLSLKAVITLEPGQPISLECYAVADDGDRLIFEIAPALMASTTSTIPLACLPVYVDD